MTPVRPRNDALSFAAQSPAKATKAHLAQWRSEHTFFRRINLRRHIYLFPRIAHAGNPLRDESPRKPAFRRSHYSKHARRRLQNLLYFTTLETAIMGKSGKCEFRLGAHISFAPLYDAVLILPGFRQVVHGAAEAGSATATTSARWYSFECHVLSGRLSLRDHRRPQHQSYRAACTAPAPKAPWAGQCA